MNATGTPILAPSRHRYLLGADAFLVSGVMFMVVMLLELLVWSLIGDHDPSLEWINMVLIAVGAMAAAVLTWWLHVGALRRPDWLALLLGTLLGGPLLVGVVWGLLAGIGQALPNPFPESEGPWGLVILVTVAVVAGLAVPVVAAIRDLAGPRKSVWTSAIRLAALALWVVIIVVSLIIGGEGAEAGLFMVLFAPASVAGVLVADFAETRRTRLGMTSLEPGSESCHSCDAADRAIWRPHIWTRHPVHAPDVVAPSHPACPVSLVTAF